MLVSVYVLSCVHFDGVDGNSEPANILFSLGPISLGWFMHLQPLEAVSFCIQLQVMRVYVLTGRV